MYLYMTFVLSKRDTRPRALSNCYNLSLFCLDIVVYFEYESVLTSKNVKGYMHMHMNEQVTFVSEGGNTLLQLNSVFISGLEWMYYYTPCTYEGLPFV